MSLLQLPSVRDEAWRWSDLSALPQIAEGAPTGILPQALPWLECKGPRLLFVDGKLVAGESSAGPVTFGPVTFGPVTFGPVTFGPVTFGNVDVYPRHHALATLAGREGWTLRLGRDHAPAGLVQIIHVSTGATDHLAASIVLEDDAQASVVETCIGEGWTNRLTEIRLGKSARLMLARRMLGAKGFVSLTDHADVGEGASLVATMLAAGGNDSRIDMHITLSGEAAFAEASGVLLARDRQRHDINLVLRHDAIGAMSRQIWRQVADDRATASVAARIEVARGAQKSDGEQSLKGLLLSPAATANLKPELEIFADDVKCAHGAAVGELDRAALFYLASRGIPDDEAKALLTRAFVADALDRIGEEIVREACHADAMKWLG
jgi:Fe-S cluster assembly protein SufD